MDSYRLSLVINITKDVLITGLSRNICAFALTLVNFGFEILLNTTYDSNIYHIFLGKVTNARAYISFF